MTRERRIYWAKAAAIGSVLPVLLLARSGGPVAGLAGVTGEGNCRQCHGGTALNGGPGSVAVEFPGALVYSPGVKQRLKVTVTDAAQSRFGFQLSVRQEGDLTKQAGSLAPADDNTQVICSARPFTTEARLPCPDNLPLQFVHHTRAGTQRSTWEVDWTPPATNVGTVTVWVAGNAANGDGTIAGDRIYTKSYPVQPAAGGGTPPAISFVVDAAGFQTTMAGGAFVTIGGTNLAATTRSWGAADIVDGALPTSLDGVRVSINSKPAAVTFVSPAQLNVVAQPDEAVGPVPVTVTTSAGTSSTFTAQMRPAVPAFFPWAQKYVVATRTDFSLVGPPNLFQGLATTPAKPGEVVILWGTGFGATNPAAPAGRVVTGTHNLVTGPAVRIGGLPAEYLGGALTAGYAGLYQIAVRVPASAPDGELAVVAEFPGASSPANMFLAVQR